MDRLLRPKDLAIEPTSPNAEKQYLHWKVTFGNYLENSVTPVPPVTEDDPASAANADTVRTSNERKKRHALINTVSATIYELISDCATYDQAITTLDAAYVRPTSVVYNRHQLITTKQNAGESIDTYLHNLNRIAKTCNFDAVTAEENKNQYVRDAFINGISSPSIRQRLLENIGELTLQQACTQARALEQAQNQNAANDNNSIAAVSDAMSEHSLGATGHKKQNPKDNFGAKTNSSSSTKETCYFCGNPRHERSNCPARTDECLGCGKKGHWRKMCRSKTALGSIGRSDTTASNTLQQQIPQSFQQQQVPPQQQHQQQQVPPYQPPFLQQQQYQPPSHQPPALA